MDASHPKMQDIRGCLHLGPVVGIIRGMGSHRNTRWYRSRRGLLFGVCQGLAEWKQFSPGLVRLVVIILCVFLRFFPVFLVYLALAIFLPVEPESEKDTPEWKKRFFDEN